MRRHDESLPLWSTTCQIGDGHRRHDVVTTRHEPFEHRKRLVARRRLAQYHAIDDDDRIGGDDDDIQSDRFIGRFIAQMSPHDGFGFLVRHARHVIGGFFAIAMRFVDIGDFYRCHDPRRFQQLLSTWRRRCQNDASIHLDSFSFFDSILCIDGFFSICPHHAAICTYHATIYTYHVGFGFCAVSAQFAPIPAPWVLDSAPPRRSLRPFPPRGVWILRRLGAVCAHPRPVGRGQGVGHTAEAY